MSVPARRLLPLDGAAGRWVARSCLILGAACSHHPWTATLLHQILNHLSIPLDFVLKGRGASWTALAMGYSAAQ